MYVTQPEGFEIKGSENKVYKLKKTLYGLRQTPKAWNKKINRVLEDLKFTRCSKEPSLYLKRTKDALLLVDVYDDSLLITGFSEAMIVDFKAEMSTIFEMSDLGLPTYYIVIEIVQSKDGITLNQGR